MRNKNPSEWRVSSNLIAGRKLYGVYRIRDIASAMSAMADNLPEEYRPENEEAAVCS